MVRRLNDHVDQDIDLCHYNSQTFKKWQTGGYKCAAARSQTRTFGLLFQCSTTELQLPPTTTPSILIPSIYRFCTKLLRLPVHCFQCVLHTYLVKAVEMLWWGSACGENYNCVGLLIEEKQNNHSCDGLDSNQSSPNCLNLISVKNILRTVNRQSQESQDVMWKPQKVALTNGAMEYTPQFCEVTRIFNLLHVYNGQRQTSRVLITSKLILSIIITNYRMPWPHRHT